MLCFVLDHRFEQHFNVADQRIACPFFRLDASSWMQFEVGWQSTQTRVVAAFREQMVDKECLHGEKGV